jgi:DNA processing protein
MARGPADVADATLRLLAAAHLGGARIRRLRAHFAAIGGAAAIQDIDARIVAASAEEIGAALAIGAARAAEIRRGIEGASPSRERQAMERSGAALILPGDDDEPPLLRLIPDPPAALWIRGRLDATDRRAVAIVGSRRCSAYGRAQAGRFAGALAACGLTVVSGGARGIDGEAHRAALRAGGRTIVVLGCGVGHAYPLPHAPLFASIVAAGGAILSEHAPLVPPRPRYFPRRNRIISGLALGVLVVEAAARSGALITARLAVEEHGREAMVVPGPVDSPTAAGSLSLARDGGAAIVLEPADVLRQLDGGGHLIRAALARAPGAPAAEVAHGRGRAGSLFGDALTDGQRRILEILAESGSPLGMDELAAAADRPVAAIVADVTMLEIGLRVRRDAHGAVASRRRA